MKKTSLTLACLMAAVLFLSAGPVTAAPADANAAARGLELAGLESGAGTRCEGHYRTIKSRRCTHGPDAAPAGVDVTAESDPIASTTLTAGVATTPWPYCDGDGVSGKRFHAIYAVASDRIDRYADKLESIKRWALEADAVYEHSAARTGGSRHMRFVTDAGCELVVTKAVLSATGDDNFDNTISELIRLGYSRTDRHYLVWADANVYCGIATLDDDDRDSLSNDNNVGPEFGRIDAGCWANSRSTIAHESMHTIGGVQRSAPHSTHRQQAAAGTWHCSDEYDLMCYRDVSGITMSKRCADPALDGLFDCGHDDYFHTSPDPSSYLGSHWNPADSQFLVAADPPADSPSGRYTPLVPARILDTRSPASPFGKVGPGDEIHVQVSGEGGVPESGVTSVMMNVTVTQPTSGGHLTIYPTGSTRPDASNLNFTAGKTIPNMVSVKVGAGGMVSIYNYAGSTHVIFDVAGFFSADGTGSYSSLSPARILDTRLGMGGITSKIGPAQTVDVQVAGLGGVPLGASAVVLNATVTGPTSGGHLIVYPSGEPTPDVSNLNFYAGDTIPNLVVSKLGVGGKLSVFNYAGSTDVIFDVAGYFIDVAQVGASGTYLPSVPVRILDTRLGIGGISSKLGPGETMHVGVAGTAGVPSSGVSAVVLNVTVTEPTSGGHLSVFPSAVGVPNVSNLNFDPSETIPNLVIVQVGMDGKVAINNYSGSVHVIFDLAGWYSI